MDLFDNRIAEPIDILPYQGEVKYYAGIMDLQQSEHYLRALLENIPWENDQAVIYGKKIITKRKVAWFGDEAFSYTYSNSTKTALPWIEELLALKLMVENETNETYNSCLCNLYHNGSEGMSWHSDAEIDLKKNGAIGSLSLGAERKFAFKHKATKESVSLSLKSGSLLVMTGETQKYWQHRLPPVKNVDEPRINLTFRTVMLNKCLIND